MTPDEHDGAGGWSRGFLAAAIALFIASMAACGRSDGDLPALPSGAKQKRLFEGVAYAREELSSPRKVVLHVVTIDLQAPGIDFVVTPGDSSAGRNVRARTTSQFLKEFHVQVAINAGFFEPFTFEGPQSYYPRAGDPVDVLGLAVSGGKQYAAPKDGFSALCISKDREASIGGQPADAFNAVSGNRILLNGEPDGPARATTAQKPSARTAVALDKTRRYLRLFVADGRQPGQSEGLTYQELAALIAARGGSDALNLDGGGSSTLVVEGPDGNAAVLNSPTDQDVPGRERAVATHLGVCARKR